jgi:thiazolylpeptide-type bacteriocin precursor
MTRLQRCVSEVRAAATVASGAMEACGGAPHHHNRRYAMNTTVKPELRSLADELAALESETFEIVDYTEVSAMLDGGLDLEFDINSSCSSTSTCSSTTSTTSCCA